MAVTRAPLLSFGASGQIGKTQVYANWRGIPYARQLTKPANPKTSGQVSTRSVFSFLTQIWKLAPALAQAPWTANASGRPYTNRNKFISVNLPVLREETDLQNFIGSPGANGGLAPASIAAAFAGGDVTVTLGEPSLPVGWTITNAVAWAIVDGDPHSSVLINSAAAGDAMTPYAPVISGLAAGDYIVTAWFVYTTTDGKTAYGPSLLDTVTVT